MTDVCHVYIWPELWTVSVSYMWAFLYVATVTQWSHVCVLNCVVEVVILSCVEMVVVTFL